MLVLSRKVGEEIIIGDNVSITVRKVGRDRVSLAIHAPSHVHIVRKELLDAQNAFADEGASDFVTSSVEIPLTDLLVNQQRVPAKAR